MKKLEFIKIRISTTDKSAFKKKCGRIGMSSTLESYIKNYIKKDK